ncbi:MAG: hypothetical protein R2832_07150 [Rhodothermales bacterium]
MNTVSSKVDAAPVSGRAPVRVAVLLLFLLLSGAGQDAYGQASPGSVLDDPFVREIAQTGLDNLYDLKFDAATAAFERIDRRLPEHPIGPFLLSLTTWWEILLDLNDTSRDEQFYDAMDEVIERSDAMLKRDARNVDAMFFKGAALGFRGRLRSNRGDWFKSAMDGKKAMDYVLGVPELDPDNDDYQFGKGIYDYFAAVIPEQYPFVKPVMAFFPSGDRQRGLDLISRTADHGYFIKAEAAYFLVQIYFLYEKDYSKCLHYLNWLREAYPDNSYFHALEGRVYANWGQWSRSTAIFDEVLKRYIAKDRGYNEAIAEQALYFIARGRMVDREHDQALSTLLQLEALSARTSDDTYFKVLGRLRQGMCYDALGKRPQAEERYRQVLRMKDFGGAHDRADRYLERPYR